MNVDIGTLQAEVNNWVLHNFGHGNELATVGGLAEEASEVLDAAEGLAAVSVMNVAVGRVLRAAVKRSQGIRGTREEWDAELRKECGDVFIKLCDVAAFYEFDLADAVAARWAKVSGRDWQANPLGHGIDGAA